MERINIAEKLKDCPKGFRLYSPLYGEVQLININQNSIYVSTRLECSVFFNKYGQFNSNFPEAECLLFPSQLQRDWSKFHYVKPKPSLEAGHRVMVSDNKNIWGLYQYYGEGNKVIPIGLSHPPESSNIFIWKYIVPIEKFDFSARDITINCTRSIV